MLRIAVKPPSSGPRPHSGSSFARLTTLASDIVNAIADTFSFRARSEVENLKSLGGAFAVPGSNEGFDRCKVR